MLNPLFYYQAIVLALGQIWSNKTRSFLTTLGIIIGVASVTAVIAALTGLKTKVLTEFESFGASKMFIFPHHPDDVPRNRYPWEKIRLTPAELDAIDANCPSIRLVTPITSLSAVIQYRERLREGLHQERFHPEPVAPERRERSHRATELTDEHALPALLESLLGAEYLVEPGRRLETERDRQCVLAVRAASHDGIAVRLGESGQKRRNVGQVAEDDRVAVLDLEREAGVEDVLARRSPVHVPGRPRGEPAPQPVHERDDRIPGAVEGALQGPDVEVLDAGFAGDLPGRVPGHEPDLRLDLRQRRLDVEPALQGGAIIPERPHRGASEAVLEVEGVEDRRWHARHPSTGARP